MAGCMGNHPGKGNGCCCQLGGNAAGPEHRDLIGFDGYGITEVWPIQIFDTDFERISEMDRRTVGQMKAGGDLRGSNCL